VGVSPDQNPDMGVFWVFLIDRDVELVVHPDRNGSHLMPYTASQPAYIEAIAHLSLVVAMQFSS